MPSSWLEISPPEGVPHPCPASPPLALTSEEFGLRQKLLFGLPQTLQLPGFHLAALLIFGVQRVRAGEIHHVEHLPGRHGRRKAAGGCSGMGGKLGPSPRMLRGMLGVVPKMLGAIQGMLGVIQGMLRMIRRMLRGDPGDDAGYPE